MTSIYPFTATDITGKTVNLSEYQNQVLLIVNTASLCGFTPQYAELETLYAKYRDHGFSVLGFPCNQFGNQEPEDNQAIGAFCQTRFSISFPMFAKIAVNGPDALPLFSFLKQAAPGIFGTQKIKWNFTKFLIRRDGTVYKRYAPFTPPQKIAKDIETLLSVNPKQSC